MVLLGTTHQRLFLRKISTLILVVLFSATTWGGNPGQFCFSTSDTIQKTGSTTSVQNSTFVEHVINQDPVDYGFQNDDDIFIQHDPVNSNLKIHLPEDLNRNFTIDIYNSNGYRVLTKKFQHNMSARMLMDVSRECNQTGVYIMHYYNDKGISRTLKFQKRR